TRQAMAEVLQLEDMDLETVNAAFAELKTILQNPDPAVELDIANSIWARQGLPFKEEFLDRNREFYQAAVEELDFDHPEAASTINDWVSERTRGKIEQIVDDEIDPQTVMFLINAIYFNGQWGREFDPQDTRDETFFTADGTELTHPFMHQSDTYRHCETDDFQAVSLPYGESERINMYIFLPAEHSSLEEFIDGLDAQTWAGYLASFAEAEGDIALPRFTFEYEAALKEVLNAMGMEVAFDPARADFGAMYPITPGQNLYIEEVKHKTFIDVNERGTEAAAVTSVEIRMESYVEKFQLQANRPFFFAICDDLTDTILFMGSVHTP
ncbi:MAG: serpin family protein, partial [Bacillota bacterium]